MADVLKGFVSGNFAYVAAWFLPSFIAVGAVTIWIVPYNQTLAIYAWMYALPTTTGAILVVAAGVVLGVVLSTASTPLYRVLEGYVLTSLNNRLARSLKRTLTTRMRNKRKDLLGRFRDADPYGYEVNLILESLQKYPSETEVLPTRLGNVMRAFEEYAYRQYGMDSQSLWEPLWAVTPQPLRDDHDHARAGTDFCVAMIAVACMFGALSLVSGAWLVASKHEWSLGLLVGGVLIPALVARALYELCVSSAFRWGLVVKGMVDIGRPTLAAALGLQLPVTLSAERDMWRRVSRFVRESTSMTGSAAADFDIFRLGHAHDTASAATIVPHPLEGVDDTGDHQAAAADAPEPTDQTPNGHQD